MVDSGNVRPEDRVIIQPENYDEMVKKLKEREEQQLEKVLKSRKADSQKELEGIAQQALVKRALRKPTPDYKPLKDRTVLKDSSSEEIQALKKALDQEITAVGQRILQQLSPTEIKSLSGKVTGLKGRVTSTNTPAPSH